MTDAPSFTEMRHSMVASQLRTTAVNDQRVVEAMATVPRERFVPGDALTNAYRDTPVPLGHGRAMNTPLAVGRLLTAAEVVPEDRVLLIGAATGYSAALLAAMGAVVTAVEEHPALVEMAREALEGVAGVTLVEAPLTAGAPDGAPYDLLVVDGAVERVPAALVEQLRPEGRIVAGLIERGVRRLASGRRSVGGAGLLAFADCDCVVLPGFEHPAAFRF